MGRKGLGNGSGFCSNPKIGCSHPVKYEVHNPFILANADLGQPKTRLAALNANMTVNA
jgi:hypothetical protein